MTTTKTGGTAGDPPTRTPPVGRQVEDDRSGTAHRPARPLSFRIAAKGAGAIGGRHGG